ncbi:hypothetical protein [Streptomyces cuspidosporus]
MPVNRVSPPSVHNSSEQISQVVTVGGTRFARCGSSRKVRSSAV